MSIINGNLLCADCTLLLVKRRKAAREAAEAKLEAASGLEKELEARKLHPPSVIGCSFFGGAFLLKLLFHYMIGP